jgi:RHS repeat-associated protein
MTADPKNARPGNDGREKLGLSCDGGGFDASLGVGSGNFQATWFDPVSTRGFPLEVNIHLNTQSSFPNRVTELGNASFTYGIAVDTAEIDGIAHWFVIDADGEELNFGPTSSAPTATPGVFSQLNQIGGGFELLNAGPPESIDVYGNYNYTFDSAGRLTTVVDPSGNIQSVTRDAGGKILSVLDQSSAKTIEFEYDTPGVLARIVEGNGEAVTHFAQSSGRIDVITLKDSLGNNIRQVVFTYDHNNLLSSVHKDSVHQFSVSYQHVGNDIHLANFHRLNGGGSNLDYFVVPPVGVAARVNRETAEGGIINYDFGTNGELLKTTMPKFNGATIAPVHTYGYNSNLKLTSVSNGITNKTFTYDTLGRLTNSTVSAGQSMVFTYSGANLLTASDQNGTIGTFAYNDSNNPNSPTAYTDAGGNTCTFTYNQYGQLLSTTPPTGSPEGQSSYVYNETSGSPNFGYLEAAIDGSGNTVAFSAYTALGDVGSITTEPQTGITETTTYDYDPQRRVTEITHPDMKQQSFTYSGHYLESSLDENANVISFDFCGDCGALEGVSQPLGKSLNWSYGEDKELLGFTDANANETTYEYGKAGELKKETYPDSQYVSYTYDRYGRVEKRNDSSTRQHTYAYTNTGRLTRVAMNNPWQSASSYYYHPDGRYSSLDDEAGVTTYTYNSSRRLSKASYNFSRTGLSRVQDVEYAYFPDGRTQTMTWKDNGTTVVVWTYAYDASGQLTSITDSLGATVSYTYDGEGKILTQTNSNGTSTEYSYYEPRNWVSSIVHKNGGTPFQSFTMEFDGGANTVGNITEVTELDGSQVTYAYDDLYRLTSETRTGTNPFSRTYGYDLAGNITTIDGNPFATYDAGNKLATVTGGSTASDGIGNLTSVSGTGLTASTYTWNSLSNLRTQNAGSGNTTYYYNALQLRVHKRPPSGGGAAYRWYVFDQDNQLIGEVSTAGAQVAYTWGADGLAARRQISGSALSFYHAGPQAEIHNLTNSSGTVTDSYWFSAYGKTIASSGTTTNPYRYGGKVGYYNDGGSHSYLATWRWYNPEIGRWLSRDPIGYEGGDNQFAYVGSNPVRYVDPTGLEWIVNETGRPIVYKPEGAENVVLICQPGARCDVDGIYPHVVIGPDGKGGSARTRGPTTGRPIQFPGFACDDSNGIVVGPSCRPGASDCLFTLRRDSEFFDENRNWPNPYEGTNGWPADYPTLPK